MEKIVFTNGCFDIIHPGHVDLLKKARSLGTKLIVGLNSDRSVRAIKGSPRPFLDEQARAAVLSELRSVDEVLIFDENTPERLIRQIKPDVLVKGGDWSLDKIVGADFVLKNGGEVFSIPFRKDFSSSRIVEKIRFSGAENLPVKDDDAAAAGAGVSSSAGIVVDSLAARIKILGDLLEREAANIANCAGMIRETFNEGNKLFLCGDSAVGEKGKVCDSGSSADARTKIRDLTAAAAAFSGNQKSRRNDVSFVDGKISAMDFTERLEEFAQRGNLLIICAGERDFSGALEAAAVKAREFGCRTIALTVPQHKKLLGLCDANVVVRAAENSRASEVFEVVLNIWRETLAAKIKSAE